MVRKKEYYNFWINKKPIGFSLPLFNFWHTRMLHKAEEKIRNIRSMKILEVGVGFGFFARAAKKLGCEYLAIEMNKNLALNLRKEGFHVICAVAPPFPNDPNIGAIWLSHVIKHCATYLEARDSIEKAYLALKPGGHIVIISPEFGWRQIYLIGKKI